MDTHNIAIIRHIRQRNTAEEYVEVLSCMFVCGETPPYRVCSRCKITNKSARDNSRVRAFYCSKGTIIGVYGARARVGVA